MDPAQGETQGKSLTSKLKAKVKGVKSKAHLPGHKKRPDGDHGSDSSSDSSSDESSRRKPGPETGYNVGHSTPYTTVKSTPLRSPHSPPREAHAPEFAPPSATRTPEPRVRSDHSPHIKPQNNATSLTEGKANPATPAHPPTGVLEQLKNTMGGAAAAVGSKVGYYPDADDPPRSDPNAPTLVQKSKAALGLDKPSDPNAPTLVEKSKAALGLDKPSDPNAPTLVEKSKAALGLDKPSAGPVAGSQQPGVVDRVSGAVSSYFTSSPKEGGDHKDVQDTFPAHTDFKPQPRDGGMTAAYTRPAENRY